MKSGKQKAESRNRIRRAARVICSLLLSTFSFQLGVLAQTTNEIPPLSPAYAEFPPTFWKQHGVALVVTSLVALVAVAMILWLWLRPKPVPPLPPEVQARRTLELLRQRTENGIVLSEISQALRSYFIAAFDLPRGEPTTTEFCALLKQSEAIGFGLANEVGAFLQECDERKFAPLVGVQASACSSPATSTTDTLKRELQPAASRALELVELAEAQRARIFTQPLIST